MTKYFIEITYKSAVNHSLATFQTLIEVEDLNNINDHRQLINLAHNQFTIRFNEYVYKEGVAKITQLVKL